MAADEQAPAGPPDLHEKSPFKGKTGLVRLRNALGYSLEGFVAAYRHEDAIRLETWLALLLIPAALLTPTSNSSKALMIACVLLVLIVELINSAIEAAVDHTSLEHHPLAKRAKDIGSAAVLVALLNLASAWTLILLA